MKEQIKKVCDISAELGDKHYDIENLSETLKECMEACIMSSKNCLYLSTLIDILDKQIIDAFEQSTDLEQEIIKLMLEHKKCHPELYSKDDI